MRLFVTDPIICRNCLEISAQASPWHYSSLRDAETMTPDDTPTTFEVMISDTGVAIDDAMWLPHYLRPGCVSGWVSTEAIERIVHKNGGWLHEPHEPTVPTATTAWSYAWADRPRDLDLG
jgi:hypothetical protein